MNSEGSKTGFPAETAAPKASFADYLALTKPRLSLLSVLTAVLGYVAARVPQGGWGAAWVALGTSLAAAGVAVLNQWMESDTDAQMKRTADRPIPSGRVPTGSAFVLGCGMCILSLFVVFARVGELAALFTLLTIASYLGWYTPAKRWSRWSTEIGALAGALPPLIGWAGAEGRISALGWVLFGILFFWQIPHFMAVAWIHRADYAAVHFPMLPVRDQRGRAVARWSLVATLLLVAIAELPYWLGTDSLAYAIVSGAIGAWMVIRAVAFLRPEGREATARRLFLASIAYLPLQLGLLVADRLIFR